MMLEKLERPLPMGWDELPPPPSPSGDDASSGATITLVGRSDTAPTQPLVRNAS